MDRVQLQIAARSAGLPWGWMDRVSSVQQPAASAAVVRGFIQRSISLDNRQDLSQAPAALLGLPVSLAVNPTGMAWLLLAFPDGTEDEALRMFGADTVDLQACDAGVYRIALAGPAYEGVAVLAQSLLGPKAALDSNSALSLEPIYWEERSDSVDPRKW